MSKPKAASSPPGDDEARSDSSALVTATPATGLVQPESSRDRYAKENKIVGSLSSPAFRLLGVLNKRDALRGRIRHRDKQVCQPLEAQHR